MEVQVITMLYLFFLLTFVVSQHNARTSNGLTMKLIHISSPESPFYVANLTREESIQRLLNLSIARSTHTLSSLQKGYKDNNLTQILRVQPEVHTVRPGPMILVKVGIGTFSTLKPPYKSYYLHMDTAEELMWLQCEECLHERHDCFRQIGEPFPNSLSQSYHSLPCDRHALCIEGQCAGPFCSYHSEYEDGLETIGILASETFTFPSSTGNMETVPGIVFGCGIDNIDHFGSTTGKEAGILGLGWGPRSIVSQLKYQANERFSYCLQHWDNLVQGAHSYLKFGADIVSEQGFGSTALRKVGAQKHYYLNLQGISVAGRRLDISSSVFSIRGDGTGGTIIDTGATFTHLVTGAYQKLVDALSAYFMSLGNYKRISTGLQFELCYQRLRPQRDPFPWITLHFWGADLALAPQNAFIWLDNYGLKFCLAIIPDEHSTTLGAYQQSNIRFIYDRNRMLLLFRPEDCNHDP